MKKQNDEVKAEMKKQNDEVKEVKTEVNEVKKQNDEIKAEMNELKEMLARVSWSNQVAG